MQSSKRTFHPNELIAKQNAKGLLILAIPITVGFLVNVFNFNKTYNKSTWGAIFLIVFLSWLTFYFWYKIFDSGTKLIINKEGIWSRKSKLIPWDIVEAYHFEKRSGKTVTYILWIETKNIGQSYKLEITFLDKGYIEVNKAIEANSEGFNIRYSGMNEYEY
ncbi:MAG TPA: hypothetical protein VJU78_12320 [Chitinophagaceae bacterium]|nr:hypothetical protein [Chitinophagaceae bacterium]